MKCPNAKNYFICLLCIVSLSACGVETSATEARLTVVPTETSKVTSTVTPESTPVFTKTPQTPMVATVENPVTPTPVHTEETDWLQSLPIDVMDEPEGTLRFDKMSSRNPIRLAIGDTHIYWSAWGERHCIFQYPLTGGEIETLICSDFDDGEMNLTGTAQPQDWLLLYDTRAAAQGMVWRIKVLNLQNGTVKVIDEEPGDSMSWPGPLIDSDGIRVVWTHNASSEDKQCVETILAMRDLITGEYRELKRTCADNTIMWTLVGLWRNRLVVERDLPDNKGRGNDVFLYDLDADSWVQLTGNGQSSMPEIWGSWIVWKAGPRYSLGPTAVYDLESGKRRLIPRIYAERDPCIEGQWVYWTPAIHRPLYLYNAEKDQLVNIVTPGENENIESVAVNHGRVAWVRKLDFEHTVSAYLLEWRKLPGE